MASDGVSIAADVIICRGRNKLVRLKDGSIFGCAGDNRHREVVAAWLNDEAKQPKVNDNFAALQLMPSGEIRYYGDDLNWTVIDAPAAVGSGSQFALGALDAGADTAQAIEIAARRDPWTGGQITVLKL